MIENMHKHLEKAAGQSSSDGSSSHFSTRHLVAGQRWQIVTDSAKEVGPALFFSLIIITVSFLPVFTLQGHEGRLFKPLAFTKTFAMGAASLLSVTLVPVTMGLFIRGRIYRERANPINRALIAIYRPIIEFVLANRGPTIVAGIVALILTWIPWTRIGSEFMPPLDEGTILYMPTTLPGLPVARAREILRQQDSILKSFPEVDHVWGKAGRANTATDPAGLDMFETTISLKPKEHWRSGVTFDGLIAAMDTAVKIPGVINAWTMPIRGRIDMLATGIRTPVGIKIFGPDLTELERLGKQIEQGIQMVPGTRSAFAERAVGGYYLDIDIDRAAAARHGVNVADIQTVIATAIGGMTITQTVEGRERYGVRVRYPQELRDTPERLAQVLVPMSHDRRGGAATGSSMTGGGMTTGARGADMGSSVPQIPLGQLATLKQAAGPMVVRTEGAMPTVWVYVDVSGRDIGSYVRDAKKMFSDMVELRPGYSIVWSGQYEYMQRAKDKMMVVIPATLAIIALLLYFNFRNVGETLLVLSSLPFALVGAVWLVYALGYNMSVAVAIGFIALAGVAAETGVVMLIYLDHAWAAKRASGGRPSVRDLHDAVVEGAVERVRPKMMTVTAIMAGLLPILWGDGTGASVMKRIAAPVVGGMISSTALTLIVIPAVYSLLKERELAHRERVAAALSPSSDSRALVQ
jgi:Cu(I)/Ag(I) efflux system membrane protein CusA/SilA